MPAQPLAMHCAERHHWRLSHSCTLVGNPGKPFERRQPNVHAASEHALAQVVNAAQPSSPCTHAVEESPQALVTQAPMHAVSEALH